MDYWSPKHVELLNVMNKINHQILCILLDYRYKVILVKIWKKKDLVVINTIIIGKKFRSIFSTTKLR